MSHDTSEPERSLARQYVHYLEGLDHGIGHFMLVEVDSGAQAAAQPILKVP
jgi:hypothetical protein